MLSYTHPIIYPKCIGSGIQSTVKPNKLLSVITVCRHGFHNGVTAYMLQFGESIKHRIFVAWVVFVKAIFLCLNLKPDDGFFPYSLTEDFNQTGHALIQIIITWDEFVGNKVKGRISKRVFQENKARKIFRKTNIFNPLILTRTCTYQGVKNVCFSENLACFVFLRHPFWDSPFCLITDEFKLVLYPEFFIVEQFIYLLFVRVELEALHHS